jgi:transcription termination factor Rho
MELHLSRRLQERRIFPAFDVGQSSTRREELLLGPDVIQRVITMRRMWSHLAEEGDMGEVDATEKLLESFRRTSTNEEFLNTLPRGASDNGRF